MIPKANVKDIYPLSPMQEGMLFHALEDPSSMAYFEQVSYRVRGPLNLTVFARAWNYLFERHDILRTAFLHERTRRPLQVVLKERTLPLAVFDLCGIDSCGQAARIGEHRDTEKSQGFDLRSDALLRARVLVLDGGEHEIILSFHHILMDGWCMGILHEEFLAVYSALEAGAPPLLSPTVPYQRYIQWLDGHDRSAALRYWDTRLEGFAERTYLPGSRPRSSGYVLRRLHATLDTARVDRLRSVATAWGVTVNALFQAAWAILLGRYTCSDDVVFGTIVSGRPSEIADVDRILGLFINLIPVRARLNPNEDCRTLVASLHGAFLDSIPFSYCPIADIAARSGASQKLLDHILVFENYPAAEAAAIGPLTVEHTDRFEQTNYDFLIVIAPGVTMDVAFHFNESAFGADYIERLQQNYLHTLEHLLTNPRLRDFDAISPRECESLQRYNSTEQVHPATEGISQLFEQQVARTPGNLAVSDGQADWSYDELDQRANAVAASLQRISVGVEDRVAVLIPCSQWLPLAFLGILKAGAVYVPIDGNDPAERIRFIMEDSGCRAVLVATPTSLPLPAPILDISTLAPSKGEILSSPVDPDQLAYLIYTSGSTGQPKGVMVSHRSALNLVRWHQRAFSVNGNARATLFASPAFDASIWEMLPYLLGGGSLHPVCEETRTDAEALVRFFLDRAITHSFVPPAVCEEIGRVHAGRLDGCLRLLTGGDVLRSTAGLETIGVNNYGPTESAVVATSIPLNSARGRIPIGRPIDNTEIMILDRQGRPVPIGVAGEIHIASASLARGYWNRPALTAERFVPHLSRPSERMYRTGDLGYWEDGAILFCGRNDHQVKVRGVRIELDEIAAILEQHPDVTEAIVDTTAGSDQLIAWISPANGSVDLQDLRRFALSRLPRAMTPARFMLVPALPRTRNGKVDRTVLRDSAGSTISRDTLFVAPNTPLQSVLAAIWTAVLGVPEIGIHDNFFELGGHSLSVTRAVSQIRDRLQVKLPIRAVFDAPTIARLEAVIDAIRNAEAEVAPEPLLVARPRQTRSLSGDANVQPKMEGLS